MLAAACAYRSASIGMANSKGAWRSKKAGISSWQYQHRHGVSASNA